MKSLSKRLKFGAPLVPVIRLDGVIDAGGRFGRGLNLNDLDEVIEHAFSMKKARAVALAVNSPGGSPVQSALIYKRIRALSEEKKIPVITFCEDVAASGGYMLAIAGDEIYADESSILGSVGVISASFGFPAFLEKYGVERRVYTAGEDKGSLDPFLPEDPQEVERLKKIQIEVHEHFKQMVRERRGAKLKAEEAALFNGDVWAGRTAVDLGLADDLGDMYAILKQKFGKEVKVRVIESRKGFLRSRLGLDAEQGGLGLELLDGFLSALERRGLWARLGR